MPLIDYTAKEACYLIMHLSSYDEMIWNGMIHHKGVKWHYPSDAELCVDIQMVVCVCTCLCVHEDTEHGHTWYLVWYIVCAADDKIIFLSEIT